MYQTAVSVWLVCKLCRGSFRQIDEFIEHKKEKHFTQFQKTSCIVFEEAEDGLQFPALTNNEEHQLVDENNEQRIKIEVNDDDPVIPFSSEIIDEPNLGLVEHNKENHFTEFQKNSCVVFENKEQDSLCPIIINVESQPTDKNNEPPLKIEVTDDRDPLNPFSSEIIEEPNMGLLEPKNEFITFERETTPDFENDYISLKQPEQNPYVLLKRLTSEEIQTACKPQIPQPRPLNCGRKIFAKVWVPPITIMSEVDISMIDPIEVEKPTEIQSTSNALNISTEQDLQLQCKLCSKQLESDAHLKMHVGICALYHADRNRFCVPCNKKLKEPRSLKDHRLRFHGTEEEMLLYKFKCQLCSKKFLSAWNLHSHLKYHKKKKRQEENSRNNFNSNQLNPVMFSQPNYDQGSQSTSSLNANIDTVDLGMNG